MPWPLEPQRIREFCTGLERVLVIEHKRPLIEDQLRSVLYRLPDNQRPFIEGKHDRDGNRLLSDIASITIPGNGRCLDGSDSGRLGHIPRYCLF